jgi:hypothetical protein
MNSGVDALGPGNLVNAGIGGALRLRIVNRGGPVPRVNLLAAFGIPLARGISLPGMKNKSLGALSYREGLSREENVIMIFGGESG